MLPVASCFSLGSGEITTDFRGSRWNPTSALRCFLKGRLRDLGWVEHLGGPHVFLELVGAEKVGLEDLALAEEFFGLVVPVAAFLVVALAQGDDGVRLGGIGHDHDLGRRLAGVADHLLTIGGWAEADRAGRRHAEILEAAAADWPGAVAAFTANSEIATEGNLDFAEYSPEPGRPLAQGFEDLDIRQARGRLGRTGRVAAEGLLECVDRPVRLLNRVRCGDSIP